MPIGLSSSLVTTLIGVLVVAVALWFRWFLLIRRQGNFRCAVHHPTMGWSRGVVSYSAHSLRWFRFLSLYPGPAQQWQRGALQIKSRREAQEHDDVPFPGHTIIADLLSEGSSLTIAIPEEAFTGLSSWVEGRPPQSGSHL